jgi:Dolichyl-phosphate-mannose-protein mannosyltransferase
MLDLGTRIQHTTRMAIVRVRQGTPLERRQYWPRVALCILVACLGMSWFMYQLTLVAQPALFAPDWHGAQWVQAPNETSPVAYFRYTTDITSVPDAAYVTIAANQTFNLYVNGTRIGTNSQDFQGGNGIKAYMFDVSSTIQNGINVFAIRVSNADQKPPALRATFGVVQGNSTTFHNTGDPDWEATAVTANVYPRYDPSLSDWANPTFDASSWPTAEIVAPPVSTTWLSVNPQVYEHPLSRVWMSAGLGPEAYFVRSLSVPASETGSWLRIVATGPADIFINGKHVITWNGAPIVPQQVTSDFMSVEDTSQVQYRSGLVLGVYDITSYVHPGTNTVAIHVSAPGISSSQAGLGTLSSALNADVLTSDSQDQVSWLVPDGLWHVSPSSSSGWQEDSNTSSWSTPYFVGRPGASRTMYLSDTPTPRNVSIPSFTQLGLVIFLSMAFVIALWLIFSRYVMRRYYNSLSEALSMTCLAFLPAVALEGLMIVLGTEPLVPNPFPYTLLWATVLLVAMAVGFVLLWLHARKGALEAREKKATSRRELPTPAGILDVRVHSARLLDNVIVWARINWILVLIMLVAIPLISYDPIYQPYWQDELTSYLAAKGVLAHGLPLLPSGFLYAKAEFYSDVLALSMLIFGEQNGALRIPTILTYLASLPIFYYMALAFFKNKKLALLATAMLAFSPSDQLWGYEMRMYEQAQFFAIITCFLLYCALQKPDSPSRIYLAVGSLVLNYFSHEEIFIIFPAVVVAVLWLSWDSKQRLPEILYKKHWWIAATVGIVIIGTQLWLSKATHPSELGTDVSQQPMIEISVQNLPFYLKLLFYPYPLPALEPNYVIAAVLSIVAGVWAIRNRDKPAILLFLLFWGGMILLIFVFTLQSDRYIYPIFPFMWLLAAYALQKVFSGMWDLARRFSATLRNPAEGQTDRSVAVAQEGYTDHSNVALSWPMRVAMTSTIVLVMATTFFLPMIPLSKYNHLISNMAGWSYHRGYPDYDAAGEYVKSRWQKGDIVISVSPAISALYYVGRVDYFFSVDRALYLFDSGNGRITDTPTASTPLLSERDFQTILAEHSRVWIISDNSGYQSRLTSSGRFNFPTDVRLVYEGYGSAVYLRGS